MCVCVCVCVYKLQYRQECFAWYIRTTPENECVYIRQSMSACVITNTLHFQHSKNLPKPKIDCSASLYN